MTSIQSAGMTDVGRRRKGNEDSYLTDDGLGLYVVADGMGGHAAGEVASRIVVDTVRDFVERFAADPSGAAQLPVVDQTLSQRSNLLLNAVHTANQAVYQKAQKDDAFRGMGSTVSAVLIAGSRLTAVNVGDSPIYIVRGDAIKLVSTAHTMIAEYRKLAPAAARNVGEHLRHVLTRSMGLRDRVEPSVTETGLEGSETVVICSDGLSEKVTVDEILEVVTYERPKRSCQSLISLANERGGEDNITVIVLRLGAAQKEGAAVDLPAQETFGPFQTARKIAVDYDTEEASHRTYISEIRPEGVFLETKEAVGVGEEIWLTFTREADGDSIMVAGRVASRSAGGIEVRFEHLSGGHLRWLASLAEDSR